MVPSARHMVLAVLLSGAAWAQDAFEIQVYDSQTAAPGVFGFELHANHFLNGRQQVENGELPTHHLTHLTLEPHLGLARWCEVGFYLQTALRSDGTFDFTGVKARFKARWPEKLGGVLGLALNQELSFVRADYEADRFAWELRPIVDLDWRRLYLAVNPIIATPLGGPEAGHPALEPGVKAGLHVTDAVMLGAEYYGASGPFSNPAPLAEQTHRVFAAVDLAWKSGRAAFALNAALGYGLVGPERWIVKLIFATDFE